MAERHWLEINGCINYPIKTQLNKMVQEELIDLTNDIDKFCVSTVVVKVVQAGMEELLPAWHYHPIPGCYLLIWHGAIHLTAVQLILKFFSSQIEKC